MHPGISSEGSGLGGVRSVCEIGVPSGSRVRSMFLCLFSARALSNER